MRGDWDEELASVMVSSPLPLVNIILAGGQVQNQIPPNADHFNFAISDLLVIIELSSPLHSNIRSFDSRSSVHRLRSERARLVNYGRGADARERSWRRKMAIVICVA